MDATTKEKLAAILATNNTLTPEWCQLPKPPARCPVTTLSRSKINELILACEANGYRPPVKSASLKSRKGAARGIRIYNVPSLLAWIEAQAADEPTAIAQSHTTP